MPYGRGTSTHFAVWQKSCPVAAYSQICPCRLQDVKFRTPNGACICRSCMREGHRQKASSNVHMCMAWWLRYGLLVTQVLSKHLEGKRVSQVLHSYRSSAMHRCVHYFVEPPIWEQPKVAPCITPKCNPTDKRRS